MKKIIGVSLLAVCCMAIFPVSTVSAKSNCASAAYKNCADLCGDIVPIFESLGYGVTMGQCVSANESGNPAMPICRNLEIGDPDLFDDLFGNFGQCIKEMKQLIPKN